MLVPWYELKRQYNPSLKYIFGHWASLKGEILTDQLVSLDGGCVWGGKLMAYNLLNSKVFSVDVVAEEIYEKNNGRI